MKLPFSNSVWGRKTGPSCRTLSQYFCGNHKRRKCKSEIGMVIYNINLYHTLDGKYSNYKFSQWKVECRDLSYSASALCKQWAFNVLHCWQTVETSFPNFLTWHPFWHSPNADAPVCFFIFTEIYLILCTCTYVIVHL